MLLGTQDGRRVDLNNSFEIKYDVIEGECVLDTDFTTTRLAQYQEVFKDVEIVGWYGTGRTVGEEELKVHRQVMELCEGPVFLHVDPAMPKGGREPPIALYETELHLVEQVPQFIWVKAQYVIETSEAERIGVNQAAEILPSGKSTASDKISVHLQGMNQALKMLTTQLKTVSEYLGRVEAGAEPPDPALLRDVHTLLLRLPILEHADFQQAMDRETADAILLIYMAGLTKGLGQLASNLDVYRTLIDSRQGKAASY